MPCFTDTRKITGFRCKTEAPSLQEKNTKMKVLLQTWVRFRSILNISDNKFPKLLIFSSKNNTKENKGLKINKKGNCTQDERKSKKNNIKAKKYTFFDLLQEKSRLYMLKLSVILASHEKVTRVATKCKYKKKVAPLQRNCNKTFTFGKQVCH